MTELRFEAMGTQILLRAGAPLAAGEPSGEVALEDARSWIHDFDRRLSRFRPDSELCRLNADERSEVPASALLRTFAKAALWATNRSGGMVDSTLLDAVEQAGYTGSIAPTSPMERGTCARSYAGVGMTGGSSGFSVDDRRCTISRPPGLRLDSGGVGKGLCADAVAHRLRGYRDVVVDCGGDIRIANAAAVAVEIEHPLGDAPLSFALGDGAVATSGITRRAWLHDGRPSHHLIDPRTGQPAFTRVIQATAVAPTTLEAETLAKTALLAGPAGARVVLSPYGGAFLHADATLEAIGALDFTKELVA